MALSTAAPDGPGHESRGGTRIPAAHGAQRCMGEPAVVRRKGPAAPRTVRLGSEFKLAHGTNFERGFPSSSPGHWQQPDGPAAPSARPAMDAEVLSMRPRAGQRRRRTATRRARAGADAGAQGWALKADLPGGVRGERPGPPSPPPWTACSRGHCLRHGCRSALLGRASFPGPTGRYLFRFRVFWAEPVLLGWARRRSVPLPGAG
jgi:hypothetical protein